MRREVTDDVLISHSELNSTTSPLSSTPAIARERAKPSAPPAPASRRQRSLIEVPAQKL